MRKTVVLVAGARMQQSQEHAGVGCMPIVGIREAAVASADRVPSVKADIRAAMRGGVCRTALRRATT